MCTEVVVLHPHNKHIHKCLVELRDWFCWTVATEQGEGEEEVEVLDWL